MKRIRMQFFLMAHSAELTVFKKCLDYSTMVTRQILIEKKMTFLKLFRMKEQKICTGDNTKSYLVKLKERFFIMKRLPKTSQSSNEIEFHFNLMNGCSNIIQIIDLYSDAKYYYIILENMEAGWFLHKVQEMTRLPTEKEIAQRMLQICEPIKHLHSHGFAHLNIKMESFMCQGNKENLKIKIGGFGSCQDVRTSVEHDNLLKCDIRSLGIVMFFLCFKSLPNETNSRYVDGEFESTTDRWKSLSSEAKHLIKGMLKENPNERFNIYQIVNHEWFKKR